MSGSYRFLGTHMIFSGTYTDWRESITNLYIINQSSYIFDIWLIILGIHGGLYRELIYELMGIDGNCDGTL